MRKRNKLKLELQHGLQQMYLWRKLNVKQRGELLQFRRFNDRPWHSPPHVGNQNGRYLLTAACYEHRHIVGLNPQRMAEFTEQLLGVLEPHGEAIYAWCILPNHYHALVLTRKLRELLRQLGLCMAGQLSIGMPLMTRAGARSGSTVWKPA